MATCFCGCGEKVKFSNRNLNKQGQYTAQLTAQLREAIDLVKGAADEVDPSEIEGSLSMLGPLADEGDLFVDLWESELHDELPPPRSSTGQLLAIDPDEAVEAHFEGKGVEIGGLSPREALAVKKNWIRWRKQGDACIAAFTSAGGG